MSRLPPGMLYVVVAAAGALALGVGAVATIDGNLWGLPLALGGAVLLAWSLRASKRG
jgi:membrane-bound ClpP family serine protease